MASARPHGLPAGSPSLCIGGAAGGLTTAQEPPRPATQPKAMPHPNTARQPRPAPAARSALPKTPHAPANHPRSAPAPAVHPKPSMPTPSPSIPPPAQVPKMTGELGGMGDAWYEVLAIELSKAAPPGRPLPKSKEFALKLLNEEAEAHAKVESHDDKLSRHIMKSGTLSDRVAALALKASSSPIHSLDVVDQLLALCEKKQRRAASMGVEACRDLFQTALLPDDRRLRYFNDSMALVPTGPTANALALAAFEDELKARFQRLVRALDAGMRDPLDHFKRLAMRSAFELVKDKPEQEIFLLNALVNKLGDPEPKIASYASHLLMQLTTKHPAMRVSVTAEVEALIMRPGTSANVVYSGVTLLNQTVLRTGEKELAEKLVGLYFALYETGSKAGLVTLESTLLSALLTGVNRAMPFTSGGGASSEAFASRIDALHKIARESNFGNATQALSLLLKLVEDAGSSEQDRLKASDRFFQTLYGKLLDPALLDSSKKTLFLNLVYRAIRQDQQVNRAKVMLRRLLQVGLQGPPGLACAAVLLLSAVIAKRPELAFFGEEALPASLERLAAGAAHEDGSDEEEAPSKPAPRILIVNRHRPSPSDPGATVASADTGAYRPDVGNPLLAGDAEFAWECALYRSHYHPSVRAFALQMGTATYSGDPIKDFSLSAFLDRFVYRNPKEHQAASTGPIVSNVFGPRGRAARVGERVLRALPTNSEQYYRAGLQSESEAFFHAYLARVKQRGGELARGQKGALDYEQLEDEFADMLANDLMKQAGGGLDPEELDEDVDLGELDEDAGDDGEEDEAEGDDDIDEDELELEDGDEDNEDDEEGDEDNEDDEDDEDEEALDGALESEEEEEEDDDGSTAGGHALYADADEFADLIAAKTVNPEQIKWERERLGLGSGGRGRGRGGGKRRKVGR